MIGRPAWLPQVARRAVVAAALLASLPALARPAPPPPPPVATAPVAPVTLTPEQRTAIFAPVDTAGDPAGQADALLAIIDDATKSLAHGEAYTRLGLLLHAQGAEIAATHAFAAALVADATAVGPVASVAVEAAVKGQAEMVLAEAAATHFPNPPDPATRSTLAFQAAKWHLRAGNLGPGLAMTALVDPSAAEYTDALALRGVLLAQSGRPQDAIGAFQDAAKRGESEKRDPKWIDAQELNLARSYYAAQNWGMAIFHDAQIPRGSDYWPEAQFERAWAHFRANDMNNTIAQLMTQESPFFADWYYPEGDLLRAYALFMMCKFPDAEREMDEFQAHYKPLLQSLTEGLQGYDGLAGWNDALAVRDGKTTKLPTLLLRQYVGEERFGEAIAFVAEADREAASLPGGFSGHAIGDRAKQWIEQAKQERMRTEGERVRDHAQAARTDLSDMLQGVEITRLDLLNLKAQLYERAAAVGKLEFGDRIGRLRKLNQEKVGFHVWPYEGEYWADELGWYQIDAHPDCPDGMATGGAASK